MLSSRIAAMTKCRRLLMFYCGSIGALALAAALIVTTDGVRAADESKYPNWKGRWEVVNAPGLGGQRVKFDPNKESGPAQQAPLTAEYQKVYEASMADQAKGGLGNFAGHSQCLPGGMPTMMTTQPQEYVITPHTTYILLGGADHYRRVFTDGRDFPAGLEPTYQGYSIGRWIDEAGSGRYDVLEVETRGPFKGPRAYDATGLPLAFDNQSIFKERFHLDRKNPNILHDDITVFDNALTRPWSVDKTFRRSSNPRPDWPEIYCVEGNDQIVIGTENYIVNGEGLLMPAKRDQAPPDLRYFGPTSK
jgi:hypothetical protein